MIKDKNCGFQWNQCKLYDFNKKEECQDNYIGYMLLRTQMIFEWTGLPDTIPAKFMELMLQVNGYSCIAKHGDDLYAFYGGLGGYPDPYYQPTQCVVANPALNFSKTFEIGKDCVLMRNDVLMLGLLPLFRRYATAMVENDISFRMASINTRISALITAPDDNTKLAAETYLRRVEDGELGAIGDNPFLEGIKSQPYSNSLRTFTDLIEYQQYLKASWYNEIGLNANYNMKREKLSTTESQMNNDALLPLVDQMLRSRQEAAEQINEMFGTDIHVEFASSWEKLVQEFEESNQLDGDEVNENENGESTISESGGNDSNTIPETSDESGEVLDDSSREELREEGETETVDEGNDDDSGEAEAHEEVSDSDVSVEVDVEVNVGDESNQLDDESEVTDDEEQRSSESDSELRDDDADE